MWTWILSAGGLGEPDLLRKQDQGYVAGDIKSGAGLRRIQHVQPIF